MTLKLVATEGDTVTQEDAHTIPTGSGTYSISPVTLQDFVFVNEKLVVVDGQTYEAHGTATCVASSDSLFINSFAVVSNSE